jgi:hypothetical protein
VISSADTTLDGRLIANCWSTSDAVPPQRTPLNGTVGRLRGENPSCAPSRDGVYSASLSSE